MDENKQNTAPEQQEAPVDYSRYMGTLNRIYRRNNNPKKRRLGDGITSLKKNAETPQPAPAADGKKDHSFVITLAICLAVILLIWLLKKIPA